MTDSALQLRHTFGSIKRRGTWRVPATVTLSQRMGSTKLDFTDAILESERTVIDVDMIGGSIELKVPPAITVEAEVATTLASYQDHRRATSGGTDRVIVLRGRAIWGSVEVR